MSDTFYFVPVFGDSFDNGISRTDKLIKLVLSFYYLYYNYFVPFVYLYVLFAFFLIDVVSLFKVCIRLSLCLKLTLLSGNILLTIGLC